MAMKSAQPKKETARITLPGDTGAKPALPKATVKMAQTQPLVSKPPASITQATSLTQAPQMPSGTAGDPAVGPLSIAATVLAIAALVIVFMAFQAAAPL